MRSARVALVGTMLALGLASAKTAQARATTEWSYRLDEVFSTAQRFIRVDRGCRITDKDPDSAFVIFECPIDEKKTAHGALELFKSEQRNHENVRVQITLSDDSHGAELRFLELLERKLRDERGLPREPVKKPAPTPLAPPDMGAPKSPF